MIKACCDDDECVRRPKKKRDREGKSVNVSQRQIYTVATSARESELVRENAKERERENDRERKSARRECERERA
jgi:hypothetical protein